MERSIKDLAQILREQGTQIANLGSQLVSNKFAVVPSAWVHELYDYEKALSIANKSDSPVVIVRILTRVERKQKYGIVTNPRSVLFNKKVVVGKANDSGLVRCSELGNSTKKDYVSKKFIQLL